MFIGSLDADADTHVLLRRTPLNGRVRIGRRPRALSLRIARRVDATELHRSGAVVGDVNVEVRCRGCGAAE